MMYQLQTSYKNKKQTKHIKNFIKSKKKKNKFANLQKFCAA